MLFTVDWWINIKCSYISQPCLCVSFQLFTRSCLLVFESWSNLISTAQLVPIGILVSGTATPTKLRSHQGHVCVLSSQVNHPSNMPATGLKLTDQDRVGDTLSEGLNGRWHAKMHPKPDTQIQHRGCAFSKQADPKQVRESCKLVGQLWKPGAAPFFAAASEINT